MTTLIAVVVVPASMLIMVGVLNLCFAYPRYFRSIENDPRSRDAQGNMTPFYRKRVILGIFSVLTMIAFIVAGIAILDVLDLLRAV